MTPPKRPRDYLEHPSRFGIAFSPQLRQLDQRFDAKAQAALVQHRAAFAVNVHLAGWSRGMPRDELLYQRGPLRVWAKDIGMDPSDLWRKLRGLRSAHVRDYALWALWGAPVFQRLEGAWDAKDLAGIAEWYASRPPGSIL